ncbi:RagB/SusD family nutrient uptake outer membrane protein [Lutibacter citreus]|uniref:RagB/SusD family nutrient uptake outer membrane protein n=1 Tax=Lutibacter citreus TaxID=2138210 RepID=UPI000DBE5284|nr:RagB/SusD family nutrient uptake outer membrane protein [Lutibacter citreus]
MKKIIKYISILGVVLVCFTSCELTTPIDEIELQYQLEAEAAISNEGSADLALAGAYSSLKEEPTFMLGVPSALSGLAGVAGAYYKDEITSWMANEPLNKEEAGDNLTFSGMAGLYRAINDANWIIEKVGELNEASFSSPQRKAEMLGEAYGIRALSHFYLLRYYGQWYDTSSIYGIALRLEPIRDGSALPRNTVAETYAQIHSDLDFAITNAPDLNMNSGYINKIGARAIKAKAYLYAGDYGMAASTAKALIDGAGGTYGLSPTYNEIFDNTSQAIFNNPEILFGLRGTLQAPLPNTVWAFTYTINGAYTGNLSAGSMTVGSQTINYDLDRINSTIGGGFYGLTTLKVPSFFADGEDDSLVYYARMAEVYLIYAEAEARNSNSVTTDALDALNAIRLRAGATDTGGDGFEIYPDSITLDQFLEAVRIEKTVELLAETGEEWFDIVRYDWVDGFGTGFQVSDYKPSATNSDKFILPFSRLTLEAGFNIEIQNPSYE